MDEVVAKLRDVYLRAGKPASAHMDLTWRCPLSCQHCYLQTRPIPSELSTPEICDALVQLRALGTLVVVFSGGEILLRPDLERILEEASTLGFGIRLKTTGWGAQAGFWQRLASFGVVSVDVSFYASQEGPHDWVTRRPGSFGVAMDMVRQLVALGIPVRGILTVLKGAVEDPGQVARELGALGVPHVDLNHYSQVGCASVNAAALALGEEGDLRFMKAVLGTTPLATQPLDPEERGCNACLLGMYIAPDGGVGPCVDFPNREGNLRETPLLELWQRIRRRIDFYNPRLQARPKCLECHLAQYGYYCPALALAETGDPASPGPELCGTCQSVHLANVLLRETP